jgi:hypothetical protein
LSGVREVDWGWCQSLWWTKERERVVVAIRGEGVRSGVVVVVGGGHWGMWSWGCEGVGCGAGVVSQARHHCWVRETGM